MIDIASLQRLFAAPGADLAALCRHPDVNKWSRHKPLVWASPSFSPYNYGYRTGGNCGLIIPQAGRLSQLLPLKAGAWQYTPPEGKTGLINEWFRLGDFDGYCHAATPPLDGFNAPGCISQSSVFTLSLVPSAYMRPDKEEGAGSITLDDLSVNNVPLSQMYFGTAFFTSPDSAGAHRLLWAVSAATAGTLTLTAQRVPSDIILPREIYAVPFLSTEPIGTVVTDRAGVFIVPPCCHPSIIQTGTEEQAQGITSMSINAEMVAALTSDGSDGGIARIDVEARLTANAVNRYSDCSVTLWKGRPDAADSRRLATVWTGDIITSISTPWRRSWKVTDFNFTPQAQPGYYADFRLASGSYVRTTLIAYPVKRQIS